MTDQEIIEMLVQKTGTDHESARRAYEYCGKDAVAAQLLLENPPSDYPAKKVYSGSVYDSSFKSAVHRVLDILIYSRIKAVRSKEIFTMPLFIAVIIMLMLWEIALPASVVSLFFGVSYIVSGPDLKQDCVIAININK